MTFWKNFLDLSQNRKIKAFMLATALLCLGKLTGDQWIIAMGIYIAGNSYEKIARMQNKGE